MKNEQNKRRDFLKNTITSATGLVLLPSISQEIIAGTTKIKQLLLHIFIKILLQKSNFL